MYCDVIGARIRSSTTCPVELKDVNLWRPVVWPPDHPPCGPHPVVVRELTHYLVVPIRERRRKYCIGGISRQQPRCYSVLIHRGQHVPAHSVLCYGNDIHMVR